MGAKDKWGFDKTVTKKYGCEDFAYDPTCVLSYFCVAEGGLMGDKPFKRHMLPDSF